MHTYNALYHRHHYHHYHRLVVVFCPSYYVLKKKYLSLFRLDKKLGSRLEFSIAIQTLS